jgi:hypothetical protein
MAIHYTAMGKRIDMDKLARKHASKPALGNAGVNARGDRITKKGIVIKTQEQIEFDLRQAKIKQLADTVELVDIKDLTLRREVAAMQKEMAEFEPVKDEEDSPVIPPTQTKRRKIVEAD